MPFAFRAESAQCAEAGAPEPGIEVEYDQSTSNDAVGAGYSDVPGLEVILTPPGPLYVIRENQQDTKRRGNGTGYLCQARGQYSSAMRTQ